MTAFGRMWKSAVVLPLPYWLTMSAATPAACGEAIDVPWSQAYHPQCR